MPSKATSRLRHALIGGYTAEGGGSAVGVSSLVNRHSGAGTIELQEAGGLRLTSPTWLVKHPAFPLVLAAGEGTPATVSSLRLGDDGALTLLSTVETGGTEACHLALTGDGHYLVATNYGSGSVSSFAVAANGTLSERVDLLEFAGSGPDTERQAGPHAHQAVFDGSELLVCDLGGDRVHRLSVDGSGRFGEAADPVALPPGSGPRHLVVLEDYLVVACELSAELWLAERVEDGWEQRDLVPATTRPTQPMYPSGIVADAERIYVANRGPNTVAVFDLDRPTKRLVHLSEFGSGGAWPRDLVLDGGQLWVANQDSDRVTVFPISPLPPHEPIFEIASPSPARVLLVHEDPGPR